MEKWKCALQPIRSVLISGMFALRLDVSTSCSQLLCSCIEPTVLPFSKALLREYIRYATLASKLLRFALTT